MNFAVFFSSRVTVTSFSNFTRPTFGGARYWRRDHPWFYRLERNFGQSSWLHLDGPEIGEELYNYEMPIMGDVLFCLVSIAFA